MEFEKERNDIKKTLRLKFYSITCTRGSDELGRHVSQSNKEKIMMGQYIDLALLLKNSNVIEAHYTASNRNYLYHNGLPLTLLYSYISTIPELSVHVLNNKY
jgi:hypothetical protein